MQQTIKNTTTELLASLPEEHVYFTPSDFRNAGFPEYLIQRILLEVDRNLAESIQLPDTEWVDMQAENVREAWDQFLSAIKAESRVPASYAHSVIESSVEDIVDQLTQPRSYLLDTLIGEKNATLYQIQSRKYWVVTNTILAEALIRYMQRKELDAISREKAHQVISHVDDKLTEGFTSLKWAQHLDPVFSLLNNEVPSALFVRFFNDRDLQDFAKWIDRGPEFLSRTTFIERISTVGMLPDVENEEIESKSTSLSETQSQTSSSIADLYQDSQKSNVEPEESNLEESREADAQVQEEAPPFDLDEHEDSSREDELLENLAPDSVSLDEVLAEESESDEPLFAQFLNDEAEVEAENEDDEQNPFTLTDSEPESDIPVENEEYSTDSELEDPVPDTDDEEVPKVLSIAESFGIATEEPSISDRLSALSEDEADSEPVFDEEEIDEPEDTPPIIDASSDDEHVIYLTDRAKKLLDLLEPNFETFVVEIFLNDELDFYKHLENIAAYDQWRSAGRYITRDIFDRNRIDLYSEPAVMFTDAVQEFFDQNA